MADKSKLLSRAKEKAKSAAENIKIIDKDGDTILDMGSVASKTAQAGEYLAEKAGKVKDLAIETKEDLEAKLNELDNMLQESITNYNDAYTQMNDKGIKLYVERCRAVDAITDVENLVNSIANRPKEFDSEFEEIETNRKHFTDSCEFANRELEAAREAAGGAGAGLAAGASVAFMGPTAAMWVATTFGTASTGTAISTLSGAAATNAALAWLGGGAVAAGGGGTAEGTALLAMAGPIGWTIAGATLLTSILLFAKKRTKINKEKNEEIEAVKKNTEAVKETEAKISQIINETKSIMDGVKTSYTDTLSSFGKDYQEFTEEQKLKLGSLVNNTKALSAMFNKTIS